MIKVLFVTSEAVPLAKTGGLGDVCGQLPKYLAAQGVKVSVVLPKYSSIKPEYLAHFKYVTSTTVQTNGVEEYVGIFKYTMQRVTFYLIDNEKFFKRDNIYGYDDDFLRFGFFDLAVIKMIELLALKLDVIHLHDWQAAMLAPLIRENYQGHPLLGKVKLVQTIHNAAYQGLVDKRYLSDIFQIDMNNYYNGKTRFKESLSYLKAGIVYADKVTTVSESYVKELQRNENDYGLGPLLLYRRNDFIGILNGIDNNVYDPSSDQAIAKNYTRFDANKAECKKALQRQFHLLENPTAPLFVVVSRLTFQKGIELLLDNIDFIVGAGAQLIVLGQGERQYETALEYYCNKYPDSVRIYLGYNDLLAHQIYAGGDIFVMPSLFEPCGIGQLIALRYGCIPVVRNTGGLKDSVIDFMTDKQNGTGFVFNDYDVKGLKYGLYSAISKYKSVVIWRKVVKNAMSQDFSWHKSATKYVNLYHELCDGDEK